MMKILVLSARQTQQEALLKLLPGATLVVTEFECDAAMAEFSRATDQYRPEILVMDCHECKKSMLGTIEQVCMRYPEMAVFLLCDNPSSDFIIAAMRSGVREVLSSPLDEHALLSAISRAEQRIKQTNSASHKRGQVIAFIACKGGSGATFLATNAAYILAAETDAKVALLDLNMQFGDAALFVSDRAPANTLSDLADNIGRLDISLLKSSMLEILPSYHLLPAPEDAGRAASIRPEHIEVVLSLARAHYDYVILDIGRLLNAATLKALDLADEVYPVMQETLPFIRDSKRLIHTLQSLGYSRDKIRPLVNRYEKGGSIGLADVELAIGVKIFETIPNSYESVSSSVNQGIPILKIAKNDPVTKALHVFVLRLVGDVEENKEGWISRIFRRG